MANTPSHPSSPPPAPPAKPAQPPQASSSPPQQPAGRPPQQPPHASSPSPPPAPHQTPAVEEDLHPPQKFKRPLAQPGDKDYVTGQPTTDEEADKVEKEEADRHAAAKKHV